MAGWVKSTRCDSATCVEVKLLDDGAIAIRSSAGPVLVYSPEEWDTFVAGAKLGEFDRDRLMRTG